MAKSQPIAPFPADICRDAFGHYLSGLTDGEGCFFLRLRKDPGMKWYVPTARFMLRLRADDQEIVYQAQSFWQCGFVKGAQSTKWNDQIRYHVNRWADLASIVVAHFDHFPLRAKKKRDFVIWREAVLLGHEVAKRRRRQVGRRNGLYPTWSSSEREHFAALSEALKRQRVYMAPPEPLPEAQPKSDPQLLLFG